MRIFLMVFLCLFSGFSGFGQTTERRENIDVKVESLALMRDDGRGEPGTETEVFKTSDRPIHFQIELDSLKPALVKLILAAVEVKGLKSGIKVLTISYKTNGEQNIINFKGAPKTNWLAGKYRIEIFIDGKLAADKEFEIEQSATPSAKQTDFAPRKAKQKNE